MPTKPLDRIDRQILGELRNNARLSNKELAARVGLAPSSCLSRVRRLEQNSVLRGYHADVDLAALDIELEALIMVQLVDHSHAAVRRFRKHVSNMPAALAAYHVAGRHDFLVHIGVGGTDELREVMLSELSERAEVGHIETALIFDRFATERNPG